MADLAHESQASPLTSCIVHRQQLHATGDLLPSTVRPGASCILSSKLLLLYGYPVLCILRRTL
jgi:hypothetical protein